MSTSGEKNKKPQASASESFLWVNKTRESSILTRSESQETSAIRKHVLVRRRQIKADKASAYAATSLGHRSRLGDRTLPFRYCPSSPAKDASPMQPLPGGLVKPDEDVVQDGEMSSLQVHFSANGDLILTNPFGVYPSQHIASAQMTMKWCNFNVVHLDLYLLIPF